MNKIIKVLIVDDSAFMRKIITDILGEDPYIKVVGTARDGYDALKKVELLNPDIITLDVEMPRMNGLETLEKIMNKNPLPVIMFSSLTKEGAEITVKALELGAVDFITKPSNIYNTSFETLKTEIINKIKNLSNSRIVKKSYIKMPTIIKPKISKKSKDSLDYIITIGTSTGGPSALKELLIQFPKNIPAGILIVQHMPANFTKSLAERLNNICDINIVEAKNEDEIKPGCAYIAPGNYHLEIKKINNKYFTVTNQEPSVNGHRPSFDVLVDSISENVTLKTFTVVLTGMGKDGSKAIERLKTNIIAKNLAQNEETCVVYGMPKAAIETGKIDSVLPIQKMGQDIIYNMIERS